jgi:hypothetical protein
MSNAIAKPIRGGKGVHRVQLLNSKTKSTRTDR